MSTVPLRISTAGRWSLYLGAFLVLITSSIAPSAPLQTGAQTTAVSGSDQHRAMLSTYCVTCHSARVKSGGLALDGLDLQKPEENAQVWEKALRKLRGRLMPPPGNLQPPQKDIDAFVAWMETTLDSRAKGPKAGYVSIQRLNRSEYAASVKALVGVDVNAKDVLPQDIQVHGFDNIAAALTVSPAFLDQYISAARHIAKIAVSDISPPISSVTHSVATNPEGGLPMPPGTRGGIRFKHDFPVDGEYRINILDLGLGVYTSTLENESTLVILLDDKIIFSKTIGGPADQTLVDRKGAAGREEILSRFTKIPVRVDAGERDMVVTFIDRSRVVSDENVSAGFTGIGALGFGAGNNRMSRLGSIEIVGPYNPTGIAKTPSRALIFVCDPKTAGDSACARKITENLAHRAFRGPVPSENVDRLLKFYEAGRTGGGSFELGIQLMVAAVLGSPEFLFRSINGVPDAPRGSAPANPDVALTDLELASRLSFFIWNTGPDDELLALAESGGLTRPGALDKQVKRMMTDAKASSLVTSFAMKWLDLANLDAVKPDPLLFKDVFNDKLRRDLSKETEDFLSSILLEDRNILELLTAEHTFVNDAVARHYGIPGVYGSQFRRITLTDKARFGLLGKGAVLLRTSYADRTSPVLRGAWVLDKLMGTPPSPPPPNVATTLDQKAGETPKTIRARLEQHREKAICMQCHGVIDPTGLPLETFDAIGRWRTTDSQADNAPIDTRTVLPNGVAISGAVELRTQLASRPAVFAQAITEKLMMYALNRELEYFDMPQARAIVREAAKDNYKFASIVLGVVKTEAFRRQGKLGTDPNFPR